MWPEAKPKSHAGIETEEKVGYTKSACLFFSWPPLEPALEALAQIPTLDYVTNHTILLRIPGYKSQVAYEQLG